MAAPTTSPAPAIRGASLLILLQILSRALTFVANQFLLRYLTAAQLGLSAQLEVYHLSILFFARESLRVALQRTSSAAAQPAVNLSYLSLLLGCAAAPALGWAYRRSSSTIPETAVVVYATAAAVELLAEPAFVALQLRLRLAARARAEAVAALLRCAATFACAVVAARRGADVGVLPFAAGQAAYSAALVALYLWDGRRLAEEEGFSLLPARLAPGRDCVLGYFHRPTLNLASSMMAQSLVKHVLTQGDTFLVSVLSTPTAQGVYALANNYGGLVARLVFQPVEESSRSYFSRLLAGAKVSVKGDADGQKAAVAQAKADLRSLLKIYCLLSLAITAVGPFAAPRLLSLVAGPRWVASGAGACLAAYAWYIPLLAVNGVSEAFVASVATEAEVHRQSAWMTFFSLAFACAGVVSLRVLELGAVGLVWANGINMLCRIVWCAVFISRYFGARGLTFELGGVVPDASEVLGSAVTFEVIRRSLGPAAREAVGTKQTLVELVTIAAIAIPYVGLLAYSERRFLLQGFQMVRGQGAAKP